MTREEAKNLEAGDYVCLVTAVEAGKSTEESMILEPKRVSRVTGKGVCTGKNENLGKPWVMFWYESYLIGKGCEEGSSCYGGDAYYVVPNKEQRKRWKRGIYYKEFIQI